MSLTHQNKKVKQERKCKRISKTYKKIITAILIIWVILGALILSPRDSPSNSTYIEDLNTEIQAYETTVLFTQSSVIENILIETSPPLTEIITKTEDPIIENVVIQTFKGLEEYDTSFKSYMDYRCITNTSSKQYEIQQQAYTDDRGLRRIDNDLCVALGTYYTSACGERFEIVLDSGNSFTAIVSDVKDNSHTDSTNRYIYINQNKVNVIEFIIDTNVADNQMLNSGNVGHYADLSGNIIEINKLN